jgi:hypothetical protein
VIFVYHGSRYSPEENTIQTEPGRIPDRLLDHREQRIDQLRISERHRSTWRQNGICPVSQGLLPSAAWGVVGNAVSAHMRNWSYHVLEREVRANLVYRQSTEAGARKAPDAKTFCSRGWMASARRRGILRSS